MKLRAGLVVAAVVVLAAVVGWKRDTFRLPGGEQFAGSIHPIFQPSAEDERLVLRSIKVDDPSERVTKFVNGLPYSWYPAIEDPIERVIHPGVIGRVLYESAKRDPKEAAAFAAAAETVAMDLPNGGKAWYYPRQIKIARLLGPDLKYSAMTAGDVLAGYTQLGKAVGFDKVPGAEASFKALTLPWEQGGVAFEGKALLELPLFRSAPEVVLNGWLHALVELSDYAELSRNPEAASFLQANVEFLARTLPFYDAPEVGLSRYSDTSPYRVTIKHNAGRQPRFAVRYLPRLEAFEPIYYELGKQDPGNGISPYDNQIIAARDRQTVAMVSCNSKYSTVIRSPDAAFQVSLSRGAYDWVSIMPDANEGERIELSSSVGEDGWNEVAIDPAELKLICGYPTNFSKRGGKNYYHVQHFVGLLYVAAIVPMPVETRCTLERWAFRWRDYTQKMKMPPGLSFEDPQIVLAGLNPKPLRQFETIEQLYAASETWFGANCSAQP